jgi:hypothetical protein
MMLRVVSLLLLASAASAVVPATFWWQEEVYYTLQKDVRRCISPICGGYFIATVGKELTRCADRSRAKACYVAALDLSGMGLTGEDENRFLDEAIDGIVAGTYKLNAYDNFKGIANLVVSKGFSPFKATPKKVCDCAKGEICVDDPADDCVGCDCPVVCRPGGPIVCGGPEGLLCPGELRCVADPNSECDRFSTKCLGVCAYIAKDAGRCGTRGAAGCAANQGCLDDLLDDCDGRVDCPGFCGQKVGDFCGGFAGFSCGEGLECVGLKGGACDTSCGGADCGGTCLYNFDAIMKEKVP